MLDSPLSKILYPICISLIFSLFHHSKEYNYVLLFQKNLMRRVLRRNRITNEIESVIVSNRNHLSAEKHLELLTKADSDYEYLMVQEDNIDYFQ